MRTSLGSQQTRLSCTWKQYGDRHEEIKHHRVCWSIIAS